MKKNVKKLNRAWTLRYLWVLSRLMHVIAFVNGTLIALKTNVGFGLRLIVLPIVVTVKESLAYCFSPFRWLERFQEHSARVVQKIVTRGRDGQVHGTGSEPWTHRTGIDHNPIWVPEELSSLSWRSDAINRDAGIRAEEEERLTKIDHYVPRDLAFPEDFAKANTEIAQEPTKYTPGPDITTALTETDKVTLAEATKAIEAEIVAIRQWWEEEEFGIHIPVLPKKKRAKKSTKKPARRKAKKGSSRASS